MSRPVLRPAAAADVEDAWSWYESRRAGLGDEFLHAVHAGLDAITAHPEAAPVMGRAARASRAGLADALFTRVQQRVLGLLFGQPDRRFQSGELIRLARGGVGAVHRQLARLEAADLVEVTRIGNQKHYQARRDSPVFDELHGLIVKTVGVAAPLRRALGPKAAAIDAAFI